MRTLQNLTRDLPNGLVNIDQGPLERVKMERSGFCYATFDGVTARVPNQDLRELQDIEQALVEWRPESRIAVNVKPLRALSLGS
jgi:hypothetical protein